MSLKFVTPRKERPSLPIVLAKTNSVRNRMGLVGVLCQRVIFQKKGKGVMVHDRYGQWTGAPPKRAKTTHPLQMARCHQLKVIVRTAQATTLKSSLCLSHVVPLTLFPGSPVDFTTYPAMCSSPPLQTPLCLRSHGLAWIPDKAA